MEKCIPCKMSDTGSVKQTRVDNKGGSFCYENTTHFLKLYNLKYTCTDMFRTSGVNQTLPKDTEGHVHITLLKSVSNSREAILPPLNTSGTKVRLYFVVTFTAEV